MNLNVIKVNGLNKIKHYIPNLFLYLTENEIKDFIEKGIYYTSILKEGTPLNNFLGLFLNLIVSDAGKSSKIGTNLLLTLEQADNELKIIWLARSLHLLVDKEIKIDQYFRITSMINKSYASDLSKIDVFQERERITSTNDLIETYVLDHLYSMGFLQSGGIDGGEVGGKNSGTIFILNEYGEIFLNKVL